MKLTSKIMPLLAEGLTHPNTVKAQRQCQELKRKFTAKPHAVLFFFQLEDPYSHLLLAQILKYSSLIEQLTFSIYLIDKTTDDVTPERENLAQYALADCQAIAPYFDIEFPKGQQHPTPANVQLAKTILLAQHAPVTDLKQLFDISECLWANNSKKLKELATHFDRLPDALINERLNQNHQLLVKKGHYNSATLYYGGEWYWGIDRLPYLIDRLNQLDANITSDVTNPSGVINITNGMRPTNNPPQKQLSDGGTLDYYFSFRSPYAYISLKRTVALAEKYQITLNIRIILPMVMRGLPVPKTKKMYIFKDAAREAHSLGIPFGKAADPLGRGVEYCVALFYFARSKNKEQQFILLASESIWAGGVDVSDLKQLETIVRQCGLDWSEAKSVLDDDSWKQKIETNRLALVNLGLWGVPSYHYNEFSCWGQDRLWLLENAIRQHLSSK